MRSRTAGVQFMRDNPERFIESNTENSGLRYLNNMSIQGTWADALIIQAVADALKVTIQIVESNQGFAPLTTIYPVQERNTPNANMADHSVIARDELHESEASEASVFCFEYASPEKSSSWTV